MKTVIVIDTDDKAGMESTRRIVDHLMRTYHAIPDTRNPFSSKIRCIKTVRGYVAWCKKEYGDEWEKQIGSLRSSKRYVEELEYFRRQGLPL